MAHGRSSGYWVAALLLGIGMASGVGVGAGAAAPVTQTAATTAAPHLAPCLVDDKETEQARAGDENDNDAVEDENGADDAAERDTDENGDADAGEDAQGAADENSEEDDERAEDDAAGNAKPGELSEGQDLLPQAKIAVEQAVTVAQAEASGTLGSVELEEQDGRLVFEVTVGDQEVFVDAMDGNVVSVEQMQQSDDEDEEDCEGEEEAQPGALDHGQDLLPEATISLEQAVQTAQGAAQGELGEVDLERVDDSLVFTVEIGDQEVLVDATSGTVMTVNAEDAEE